MLFIHTVFQTAIYRDKNYYTDVRWISYHLFLFWYWPKYFCSKEKKTPQKFPKKTRHLEKWRADSQESFEKHVLFVKRDNSQILCLLSAFKSILSCLGLLKSQIYVVITDNIFPRVLMNGQQHVFLNSINLFGNHCKHSWHVISAKSLKTSAACWSSCYLAIPKGKESR